ncbi:MAG: bifunctional demethylmenaquinone methyltransferase/2-methoxy-6-polyprenyl-1,4-benzoquinol methylase UbiE [Desulfobacteraceae bacterium]|nr:bifunctional demethylmenaquinone methyltransferase/2-methoxy-6-polyprenyl-1,4-benzoquinol methylase UbiE [Desulfobacteraceae bacterium]
MSIDNASELSFVRKMFDIIAPRYDFLNKILSLRQDVVWRRILTDSLKLKHGSKVLDMACGTGDVALGICKKAAGPVKVYGADFAGEMLKLAKPKIEKAGAQSMIDLVAADAFEPPFRHESFDLITIAFGIRNIQNKPKILSEFFTLLKPGGALAVLELASPGPGPFRDLYQYYFNRILPLVGRFFSGNSFAYTYLPDSVSKFPTATRFATMMRNAGFSSVRYRKLTLGIAVLFLGQK